MALGNRRSSCAIAQEAAFGSLTDGIPDASGLTYIPMVVNRQTITYGGQVEPMLPLDLARNGTGMHAPVTEAPYVGSTKQRRRHGDVTITGPWMSNGTTAQASTAVHYMLNTTMVRATARGADAKDTINDVTPAAHECQVTSPGSAQIGELLAFEIAGKVEVVRVTGTNGGAGPLTWAPSLSVAPANGATYRYLNTYVPCLGELALATFKPVAIRMDLHGKRFYATGCRLKSFVVETAGADERTAKFTAVFRAAAIYDADSAASPENPTVTTGGYAKFLGTIGATYTDDVSAEAAPANSAGALAATVLAARRFSFEMSWTLEDAGHGGSYLAASEWFCAGFTAMLKFPGCDPAAVFEDSARLGEYRMWTVACAANGFAQGQGFGLQLPAGFMPGSVLSEVNDTHRLQNLEIQDGVFAGDVGSESLTGAVDKSCCFGTVA